MPQAEKYPGVLSSRVNLIACACDDYCVVSSPKVEVHKMIQTTKNVY